MASEAITRNDLKVILNEVLPPTPSEYKKLLWTNPSSTTEFTAQTISLDLSGYDEVEIWFNCWRNRPETSQQIRVKKGTYAIATQGASTNTSSGINPFVVGSYIIVQDRPIYVTDMGVQFGTCTEGASNGTMNNANGSMIPAYIYGIKYERVAPPQVEEWEEIPISYTVTTGDDTSSNFMLKAYKSGDLLHWRMQGLNRAAATSAGANMWGATITGLPSSFIDVMGSSYYNTSHIDVYFQCTGVTTATITARVTGAQLSANCVVNGISAMTRFI